MWGSGIYAIINRVNGKYYIGSAMKLYNRWHHHKTLLNQNKHDNDYLQKAWNKYCEENFKFVILENCLKEQLIDKEQFWINISECYNRDKGYNIRIIATSNLGIVCSEETKRKISLSKTGKKRTEEQKLKLSLIHKQRYLTPESRVKFKTMSKNRVLTDEYKCKISQSKLGNKHSEQTKIKMKEIWRLRKLQKSPFDM